MLAHRPVKQNDVIMAHKKHTVDQNANMPRPDSKYFAITCRVYNTQKPQQMSKRIMDTKPVTL